MNLSLIFVLLYLIVCWKWGDWRNWRVYYPTILFMIVGDLIYQFIFHDYSMWEMVPVGIDESLNFKHTYYSFISMGIKYPATILLFLGRLPKTFGKRVAWIGLWVAIYFSAEYLLILHGSMIHKNDWNMYWSLLFDIVMFTLLIVHFKRPLLAWVFSILFIVFLLNIHEVPTTIIK